MGYREASTSGISYADEMLKAKLRQTLENEERKEKLLADPTASDTILAHFSRAAMTEKAAAKMPKGATIEKALSAIPEDDPRRAMFMQMRQELPQVIKSTPFGASPAEAITKHIENKLASNREATYKYIQSKSGFFGREVAPEAGYEEWEKQNPGFTSPVSSFIEGAGMQIAGTGIMGAAAKYGTAVPKIAKLAGLLGRGLALVPPAGPGGLIAKAAGAGLMMIPAMLATDLIKQGATKAGYKYGEGGILKTLGEEVLTAAPGFVGVAKMAGLGASKAVSALKSMDKSFGGITEGAEVGGIKPATWFRDGASMYKTAEDAYETGMLKIMEKEDIVRQKQPIVGSLASVLGKRANTIEKYGKLTPEDEALAAANPKKANDILNARIAANMKAEKDAAAVAKAKMDQEIEIEAKKIEYGSAIIGEDGELVPSIAPDMALARATNRLNPSPVIVAQHRNVLQKAGYAPDVIDSMSHTQRFDTVELVQANQARQLREQELRNMLPAPIPMSVTATGKPMTILSGKDQEALMKRWKAPEQLETRVLPQNLATIERIKAGGLKHTAPIPRDLKPPSFSESATKVVSDTEEAASKIIASVKDPDRHINELNNLIVKAHDDITALANTHNVVKDRRVAFDKMITEIDRKYKLGDTTALEEKAGVNILLDTAPLQTEFSNAANHMNLVKKSPLYARLRKQGKKEWESIPAEEKAAGSPRVDEWKKNYLHAFGKFKNAGLAAVAGAALIPLSTLLPNTSEAEAGIFTGKAVPEALVNAIKNSGKPVQDAAKVIVDAGFGAPIISENGHAVTSLMKSYGFAPGNLNPFTPSKVMGVLDSLASLHTRGRIHFKSQYADGTDAPTNPAIEMGYRSQVANANTKASLEVVGKIMKDYGIETKVDEIAADMEPLVKKFGNAVNIDVPYYTGRVKMLEDVLAGKYRSGADTQSTKFSKLMKAAKGDKSKLDPEDQAFYDTIIGERNKATAALKELEPVTAEFNKEYDAVIRDVASRYGTARVALAVDGQGMSGADPWLKNMLSQNERMAVDEITALNTTFATRMQETGHQIVAGPYMHHPMHPAMDFTKAMERLEKISSDSSEAMRLVNFYHRSAGSKLMIPDTAYIMTKYIPDAAKRIEVSDFWKMGKEGGWDRIRQMMKATGGYDGALKLLDDIRTAFDPMDQGMGGKWLNRYAAFEVARLLTLSPSVSFKHALKLMGNFTIYPSKEAFTAVSRGSDMMARQVAYDLAGESFKGKDYVTDLYHALTTQSHMYAAISDMAPYSLSRSWIDKFLYEWNSKGSAFVNGVERLDRGITFAASMMMAQKRGMTPDQAIYGLMDSVLNVNFLTGPNNPKWLKDPLIRTMMMFQGTPFKILEQRAMLSYRGVKSIQNVLTRLRKDVKLGEERFKWHMLKDELTKDKDIFGTPYATQFLKQLAVIGTVIYGGKTAFDSDLWGHAIHIPGIQMGERGVQLGLNPALGAAYKTAMYLGQEDPDEFWLSKFFQNWLGKASLAPAIAHKIARLNDNDIPDIYKENKLNYLFGVPRVKESE
jgi:putative transposon-encoded protein